MAIGWRSEKMQCIFIEATQKRRSEKSPNIVAAGLYCGVMIRPVLLVVIASTV